MVKYKMIMNKAIKLNGKERHWSLNIRKQFPQAWRLKDGRALQKPNHVEKSSGLLRTKFQGSQILN